MSLLAEHLNGEIIGHVLLSEIECCTDAGSVKTGAIAPGAIKRKYRSLTVAKRLIGAVVDRARQHEFELPLLVARPRVYGRVGFSADLAQRIQSPYSSAVCIHRSN